MSYDPETHFYANLPLLTSFQEITNPIHFHPLPKSWFVVVTDVKGSTKAIEAGHYKEVNMVGALTIVAFLNRAGVMELPFVFGGDGASILIPPNLYEDAKKILLKTQALAKQAYNLHLRIGIVPVQDLYTHNAPIHIARFAISQEYHQAILRGGGLEMAEHLLKTDEAYKVTTHNTDVDVDFEGLECRWEAIKSPKDETLSLLIRATGDEAASAKTYERVLGLVEAHLGSVEVRHPITAENTILSFNPKILNIEAALHAKALLSRIAIHGRLILENALGWLLMRFNIGEWEGYKARIVRTSDTEKFDDMLRMVVSATTQEREALLDALHHEFQNKTLAYGYHISDRALMTCLIFERHGRHIHFVDAADGGYAMAAKGFKERVRRLEESF